MQADIEPWTRMAELSQTAHKTLVAFIEDNIRLRTALLQYADTMNWTPVYRTLVEGQPPEPDGDWVWELDGEPWQLAQDALKGAH